MERTLNMPDNEPEQRRFELPSEKEHLLQVVDILEDSGDSIAVKIEVADGDEIGRSIRHQVSLDPEWAGFFTTRLFLKAIDEPHKGPDVKVNPDNWIGRLFFASIIHNVSKNNGKTYANISEYNFDKAPTQPSVDLTAVVDSREEKEWDE